jgi:CBS domain-containing protein
MSERRATLLAGYLIACIEALALRFARVVAGALALPERVADHMSRDVGTVAPDATLRDAALRMWERDVGSLVVTNGLGERRILGVITDRDICMAAQLRGLALAEMQVHEAMASPAVLCREADPLRVAHARMREHQVRRLPVIDAAGQLAGVITLADLARGAVSTSSPALRQRRSEEVAATLAAIASPRM